MKQPTKLAFFFIKLPLALSMLGHGLVRLPKLQGFSQWMVTFMEKSYLPRFMIMGFSYVVPFVELLVGAFLLLGIFTVPVLYVGLVLVALFAFGNTTIENWDSITSELLHGAYMTLLLLLYPNVKESIEK